VDFILENDNSTILGFIGFFIGGFIGYLSRPSNLWAGGQLPFETVITRGANLEGIETIFVSQAQISFNYLVIGAILGLVIGWIVGKIIRK